MTNVLVVDDSPVDQALVRAILSGNDDIEIRFAAHGRNAMNLFDRFLPDIVVTDLMMPEMDGLQVVKQIRQDYPSIPVILMTAKGSEATAVEALQAGAASFVPKSRLADRLADTIFQVLALRQTDHPYRQVFDCFANADVMFRLPSQIEVIPQFVELVKQSLSRLGVCDATESIRLSLALEEALLNALIHGNLELTDEVAKTGIAPNADFFKSRSNEPPYCDRLITIRIMLSRSSATFVIHDEGSGFDTTALPHDGDTSMFQDGVGRGLKLMRVFMDDVSYNAAGNEITLARTINPHYGDPGN